MYYSTLLWFDEFALGEHFEILLTDSPKILERKFEGKSKSWEICEKRVKVQTQQERWVKIILVQYESKPQQVAWEQEMSNREYALDIAVWTKEMFQPKMV